MKLTMLLCDHAAAAEGKLYINGGGWTLIGPEPSPSAIALLIEVPWLDANTRIHLDLALRHEDGAPVTQPGPAGPQQPVQVTAEFEVGRPPGIVHGSAQSVPIALNFPPFVLASGQGYYWEANINGKTREEWRASFRTRPLPVVASGPDDPTNIPGL